MEKKFISIHSPYTGRDSFQWAFLCLPVLFQSTLPIQGETLFSALKMPDSEFQSTLPIQGETNTMCTIILTIAFQSTLPIQGETRQ